MSVIKSPLTFTHVAVAGNCAFLAGCLTSTPCREAYQAHALLQVSLPVQLQQGDVVVQGLAVVVVVDVGGRHSQSLCTWRAKLLCEVVIPHPYIYSVTSTHDTREREVSLVAFILYRVSQKTGGHFSGHPVMPYFVTQ